MPETLGARLRRERELRHIDLRTIAESTKIGVPLLEGLERDDVSRWPAGIFRKAFVRSYALAIGLDADTVVREFEEAHPEPPGELFQERPVVESHENAEPLPFRDRRKPAPPQRAVVVKVSIEPSTPPFTRGDVFDSVRKRCAAAATDVAVSTAVASAFYTAMGSFWMPLAVTLAGYYAGSVLIFGNTPGVCLFGSKWEPPSDAGATNLPNGAEQPQGLRRIR